MVSSGIAVLALTTLAALAGCSKSFPEAHADEPASGNAGVAVVELFTSEGCSSCPPADTVLSDLARTSDRPVFALAFHVDYWDDLGWRDRFGSPDYSARQRAYARSMGLEGVYTPQMIVGGTEQFTGSDRRHADAAVAHALTRPASVPLSVRVRSTGPAAIAVDYDAPNAPAGSVLDVAIVERSTSTAVAAGENAGRTLHHANVVRAFVTRPIASASGSIVVQLPTSLPREGAELIAYIERASADGGGMPVLGATRSQLPPVK
jgi:hypothetical protein